VYKFISDKLQDCKNEEDVDMEHICRQLVHYATDKGSKDDLSVIILHLKNTL